MRTEPPSLASKPLAAAGISIRHATRLFNAELDYLDGQQVSHPYLAEALPQLNTDSWKVFPDGKMETSYRLRPGVTWHDGTPLSAEDFVFGWRVDTTPAFGLSESAPFVYIDEMLAPDAQTLVIRWKRPYPDATMLADTFQALPRHILGAVHEQGQPDAMLNHPFWTREYVGLGPYKLDNWEPGAFIEASAFDGHVLGRAKIDRVVIRFSSDENANLAALLASDVHFAGDRSIRFEQAQVLRRDWIASGKGMGILTPGQPRFIFAQLRPEMAQPSEILDLRVRRALAHSIDRDSINEGLFSGEGTMAHTFITPATSYFPELDRVITKYAYDPRRTEELMTEAGFAKDRDGIFARANGEKFSPGFMVESGAQNELDLQLMENTWRRAGMDVRPQVINATQLRDQQLRASFPTMYSTSAGGGERNLLSQFASSEIARPESRWAGGNRGGWSNAEYDQLWEAFNTTLERPRRDQQAIQMMKLVSENLPAFMSFFNYYVYAHATDLAGPDPKAYDALVYWNIHQWELK